MCLGHLLALALSSLNRGSDRAIGAAPADDEQVAVNRAVDFQERNVLGDVGDLLSPSLHHVLVIGRVVTNVARDVFFFDAADAVLESGRSGNGPLPHQAGVSLV